MKKVFLILILGFSFVFSNAEGTGSSVGHAGMTNDEEKAKVFVNLNDDIVENGSCSWECREVKDGYATQIIGFDFANGTTFCKVYEESDFKKDLKFNASKTNLTCAKNIQQQVENNINQYQSLFEKKNRDFKSKIDYQPKQNEIPMSLFLSSLATLNPNIIDREKTNQLGVINLKDGLDYVSIATITSKLKSDKTARDSYKNLNNTQIKPLSVTGNEYQKTSAMDGFNKNNMAYFSDLFMNMEKIYQHLQILLFVVVGGYFITSMGANKLQIYLENRGESSGKQPYLHKFYIPLLMVGTFFMPIPEANGTAHSTIVQNVIRYFTVKSNEIADMASAVGGETYMNKIYKSVGGLDENGMAILIKNLNEKKYIQEQGQIIYKNTCSKRYVKPYSSTEEAFYATLTEQELEEYKKIVENDPNGIAGTKYDITLEACIFLETQILESSSELKRLESQIKTIQKNRQEGNILNKINKVDNYFAERENQLGWINSLITPSSAILVQIHTISDEEIINKTDMKEATKKNTKNTKKAMEKGNIEINNDDISDSSIGYLAGKLVWMMLPGATAIKDFIMENITKITAGIGATAGAATTSAIGGIPGAIIGGILGWFVGNAVPAITGYIIAIMLMEWTFEMIPLLVCTTASIIAFVSYLVSLCKYFYISPFVVAFSLATKRMDKIVEFLISGISIFFKPVLIVLFIYLSLFIHTLINEIFIFMSVEQFVGIDTSWYNFHTNFITGSITGLLVIFGYLSTSYIMWKLIVSGPGWALELLGINGKQSDMISQGIENNLARRAFVA